MGPAAPARPGEDIAMAGPTSGDAQLCWGGGCMAAAGVGGAAGLTAQAAAGCPNFAVLYRCRTVKSPRVLLPSRASHGHRQSRGVHCRCHVPNYTPPEENARASRPPSRAADAVRDLAVEPSHHLHTCSHACNAARSGCLRRRAALAGRVWDATIPFSSVVPAELVAGLSTLTEASCRTGTE